MSAHTILFVTLRGSVEMPRRVWDSLPFTWSSVVRDPSREPEVMGLPIIDGLFGPLFECAGVARYETKDAAEALSS